MIMFETMYKRVAIRAALMQHCRLMSRISFTPVMCEKFTIALYCLENNRKVDKFPFDFAKLCQDLDIADEEKHWEKEFFK
jgi:hypothetical protein